MGFIISIVTYFIENDLVSTQNIQDICELPMLEELKLIHNDLKMIPSELCGLKKLISFNLHNNQIENIGDELSQMTQLELLDLSFNEIKKIPKSLSKLTNLTTLNLEGNDVIKIQGFDGSKSPKEIIEFLLLNQDKEMKSLNEAKILVLGDENSGKSSLVERMVYDRFDETYKSTRAIDILGHTLSNGMKVNIWDFAGQEVTYQVHNLFMSKESLYLLVIDGQKENNIIENFDWLETITANADNPPIIIVITKNEDNRAYRIDESLYTEKFKNLKFCYLSSKEGGIKFDELEESIQLNLENLQTIHKKIPIEYSDIKKHIEKLLIEAKEKEDFESYILEASEFDKICKEHHLTSQEEKRNLRIILNDIGTIIGFANDDMHVINPTWIIKVIYEFIRSKDIDDRGELDLNNFDDIVNDESYSERHYQWIIKFLLKNKIALKINDTSMMIPSRLSVNSPEKFSKENYMKVDKEYGLNFRYKYKKRFKKSIIFDFIMQMQEYTPQYKLRYWANGMILEHENSAAVVLSSKIDKTINIHLPINNKDSRELLTVIRKKLDKISKKDWEIDDDWDIVKEIAIVKDGKLLRYKNYKFLKVKKEEGVEKVELDIWGEPIIFKLSDLLDRYEEIESALTYKEQFEEKLRFFLLEYNFVKDNLNDSVVQAESAANQGRKIAEFFCKYFILNSNKTDNEKNNHLKQNLYMQINKLKDDHSYIEDKDTRVTITHRLDGIRIIGNKAAHDSGKLINEYDLDEVKNNILYLLTFFK